MALLSKEREERLFGNLGPPVYAPAIGRERAGKTKELYPHQATQNDRKQFEYLCILTTGGRPDEPRI